MLFAKNNVTPDLQQNVISHYTIGLLKILKNPEK